MLETIIKEYQTFLDKYSFTTEDKNHSKQLLEIFDRQTRHDVENNLLIIDCHGYKIKDIYWLMEFLFWIRLKTKIKFITGVGNHSIKPQMDYYCQKEWKNPLYRYILNYLVEKKCGSRIMEGYGWIQLNVSG